MIRGSGRLPRDRSHQTKARPDRVLRRRHRPREPDCPRRSSVFQAFRKQRGLTATTPSTKRLIRSSRKSHGNLIAGIKAGDAFLHRHGSFSNCGSELCRPAQSPLRPKKLTLGANEKLVAMGSQDREVANSIRQHLVGDGENPGRDGETKRLGSLEVDGEFDLCQLAGPACLQGDSVAEYASSIVAGLAKCVLETRSIADETASSDGITKLIHCGYRVTRGERNNLIASTVEERTCACQSHSTRLRNRREGFVNVHFRWRFSRSWICRRKPQSAAVSTAAIITTPAGGKPGSRNRRDR